ncbi:hypothetical protein BKA67DRAFT_534760 [Truncatella angustata]|uniref:Uncharacterized protein n=1 Tax=Truncatella angustata TaxID=152316 RepID=A0A9P9A086_9PEZI|nr:uncharacterized protein BKA67DRAFT_534760 [Truncatella angustata]KAH6655855.1 hypothetical protein BKA67DRAFT_534760 [Truncatella angustata]
MSATLSSNGSESLFQQFGGRGNIGEHSFREFWHELARKHSQTDLTKIADKFIAFKGVVDSIQRPVNDMCWLDVVEYSDLRSLVVKKLRGYHAEASKRYHFQSSHYGLQPCTLLGRNVGQYQDLIGFGILRVKFSLVANLSQHFLALNLPTGEVYDSEKRDQLLVLLLFGGNNSVYGILIAKTYGVKYEMIH